MIAGSPPLATLLLVYTATCYIGGLALLAGPDSVRAAYVYLTGARFPEFTTRDVLVTVVLLHLPVLLLPGYALADRLVRLPPLVVPLRRPRPALFAGPFVALVVLLAVRIFEVTPSGATAWLNYDDMIAARKVVFSSLSFWDFVAIYTVIPVVGGLALSSCVVAWSGRRAFVALLVIVLGLVLVNSATFQKRSLLTGLLIVLATVACDPECRATLLGDGGRRRALRFGVIALVTLVAAYLVFLLIPIVGTGGGSTRTASLPSARPGHAAGGTDVAFSGALSPTGLAGLLTISRTRAISFPSPEDVPAMSHFEGLVWEVALGPTTRLAGPAIAYAALYPARHPFYPPDLALDVLGIGVAPDDNQTSWALLFPDNPGGTNSVPFAFVFYTQGGLVTAILGTLLLGIVLGSAWRLVGGGRRGGGAAASLAALIIIFSVLVAGDSARNAAISSYGVVWPALAVGAVTGAARGLRWARMRAMRAG